MSHEGEDGLASLKDFFVVEKIEIIKNPHAFLQVGLLLLCIRILTIISIANLLEAWREWNEQSLRLIREHRAENPVALFDQTYAAHRESADYIDRDGGREKRTHDVGNMFGLDVNGVQMIRAPQEPFCDAK
jgi:hypothetical protein